MNNALSMGAGSGLWHEQHLQQVLGAFSREHSVASSWSGPVRPGRVDILHKKLDSNTQASVFLCFVRGVFVPLLYVQGKSEKDAAKCKLDGAAASSGGEKRAAVQSGGTDSAEGRYHDQGETKRAAAAGGLLLYNR